MCVWESEGLMSLCYTCFGECLQGKCLPVPQMSQLSLRPSRWIQFLGSTN